VSWDPRGITANVVHPGSTESDMNPPDGPSADAQRALSALGHFGTPADVAATVSLLAGPDGRMITAPRCWSTAERTRSPVRAERCSSNAHHSRVLGSRVWPCT